MADQVTVIIDELVNVVTIEDSDGSSEEVTVSVEDTVQVVTTAEQGPPGPVLAATKTTLGGVIVGDNLTVNNGTIAVPIATANTPGVVQIGANLTVNNGVLSANAGTVANLPWSNITGTPTTVSGYNISDAITKIANITHGTSNIPPYIAGSNRILSGDVGTIGNVTSYSGFYRDGGTLQYFVAGQVNDKGTVFDQGEMQVSPKNINFNAVRILKNGCGTITGQEYSTSFQINEGTIDISVTDPSFLQSYLSFTTNQVLIGSGGVIVLGAEDIQVNGNYNPGPFSLMYQQQMDQRYQMIVRKN